MGEKISTCKLSPPHLARGEIKHAAAAGSRRNRRTISEPSKDIRMQREKRTQTQKEAEDEVCTYDVDDDGCFDGGVCKQVNGHHFLRARASCVRFVVAHPKPSSSSSIMQRAIGF